MKNKQAFTLSRHAEFISASSRYQNNKTLKQVQGDGRKGFTLIELLVVVLIIGILAAVAVPQYRVAVAKSRLSTIMPLLKSIATAQEIYYLNNGQYTADVKNLDVQMSAECVNFASEEEPVVQSSLFRCGKDFTLQVYAPGILRANFCPGNNATETSCGNNRDLQISLFLLHSPDSRYSGKWFCEIKNSSALGQRICSGMGKLNPHYDFYQLN